MAIFEEIDVEDGEDSEVALLRDRVERRRPLRKIAAVVGLLGTGLVILVAELGEPALGIREKSLSRLVGFEEAAQTACLSNEENYAGLCYMKCSTLTNGEAPYRTSANQCCKNSKFLCVFFRSMTTTSSGLSVGGGTAVESQPHPPGTGGDCLSNEEPYQGQCYLKCAVATNGSYSVRTGPSSCCNGTAGDANSCHTGASPSVSSLAYAVGGGVGDKSSVHAPGDFGNPNVQTGESAIGQDCEATEEKYNGVCYQKCSIVSGGQMPYRKGPMSCCKSNTPFISFFSCMLPTQSQASLDFQVGAPKNGMTTGPHPPGMSAKCLSDEEEYAGTCYEKCSILTDGAFPFRTGSCSCCKDAIATECESQPEDVGVSVDYGGGGNDADNLPHQ
eukprot:CAMPEP_0197627644 /NCGR_PEP_ID=MMETSP1338-20131121/6196_1 /TAXON_ID=43686 ORGANISM="Pelagodinium beii, Strain RCC1491" /NCGR_SAMPLE_ID=MMETSP1338 /ASSEMBLY_ACC=CAM_ASM_000754 /LENGTH=387 /DNA_ID=CAMNT_0043198411 /DNA_START=19 /DNA_END=1179 /DNA_ORIENTATION=+